MMKGSKFKLLDEGREVCVIDLALQVTQPELKGKHQGHPPWVAQQHESKNNSELSSDRGTYGKMLNRLDKIIKEVQMAIVFIGKLTIESGEHGESGLQVCLFLLLSTYET